MKRFFLLFEDKGCNLGLKLSLILLLSAIGYLLSATHRLPPELPLLYSRPWGEEQLAPAAFLLVLPLGGLMIVFLNIGMAGVLFEESPFLARILVWSSVLVSLISSIAVFKIVTVIT